MKLIASLMFLMLWGCNQEQEPKLFNLEDVEEINFLMEGHSDSFVQANGTLRHQKHDYELESGKANSWLNKLSKIDKLQLDHPGSVINLNGADVIELKLSDKTQLMITGNHTDNSYYAIIRIVSAKQGERGKIIYLPKDVYEELFITANDLRYTNFPSEALLEAKFQRSDSEKVVVINETNELDQIIDSFNFTEYPHSGEVTSDVANKYLLSQRINGNLPGKLILKYPNKTLEVRFGRPKAHQPLTYIHIDGRKEIYAGELKAWPRLEMLLTKYL